MWLQKRAIFVFAASHDHSGCRLRKPNEMEPNPKRGTSRATCIHASPTAKPPIKRTRPTKKVRRNVTAVEKGRGKQERHLAALAAEADAMEKRRANFRATTTRVGEKPGGRRGGSDGGEGEAEPEPKPKTSGGRASEGEGGRSAVQRLARAFRRLTSARPPARSARDVVAAGGKPKL